METQNRPTALQQGIDANGISLTTFLYLYGVNLVLRFPDVSDMERLDTQQVRSIAHFCVVTSRIALEVWDEVSTPIQDQRVTRQRVA